MIKRNRFLPRSRSIVGLLTGDGAAPEPPEPTGEGTALVDENGAMLVDENGNALTEEAA